MPVIGYPLLLQPRHDEKIWGGRRLADVLGKDLPGMGHYGESLESGDAAVVVNGALAGVTLGTLVAIDGAALLGARGLLASQPFGDFPLLVKFIDARQALSLQVHPDDEGAALLEKRGKTEAWYIVDAEPGARLITGLTRAVSAEEVRQAIEEGTFESLLEQRVVSAGETLILPAGTVHAIGGGILLYEVQQASDITYRLYDWGRVDDRGRPRDLHLTDALRVLVPGHRAAATEPLPLDARRAVLAACRYFTLERWRVTGRCPAPSTGGQTFRLLSAIEGACDVHAGAGAPVPLRAGQTVLLPADLADCELQGAATLLCASIADLVEDVAGPLLDAGHHADLIARLGGGTGDLQGALASAQRRRAAPRQGVR